jgi:hypothetical protein
MRQAVMRLVLVALLSSGASASVQDPVGDRTEPGPYAGRALSDVLEDLQARGLKIVFTSALVPPEMLVEIEPHSSDPRRILDELLVTHGLTTRDGPNGTIVVIPKAELEEELSITGVVRSLRGSMPLAGVEIELVESGFETHSDDAGRFRLPVISPGEYSIAARCRGFVVQHLERVAVASGQATEISILLEAAPVIEERVDVVPSRISLMREEPVAPLALSREDILALPHLGDDFFRALSLLPGIAANDVSAEFHIRGGRRDETRILMDGQELYDSYHLKDFDSALSVVAPATLDSVDLSTGSFPVEHGDRMGGVLDMTTTEPSGPRHLEVGLSLLNAHVGGSGAFADGRGGWLAQARHGSIDFASRLLGPENPRYWDGFGKLDVQLDSSNGLRLNILHSVDEFEFDEIGPDGLKSRETDYKNSYLWLTHQAILGSDLFFETAVSRSRINRDRNALELEDDAQFEIRDRRELTVLDLRQSWNFRPSASHYLKWGFGLRRFDAGYDYAGAFNFESPLALIRENAEVDSIVFVDRFEADHDSFYVADRIDLSEDVSLELGLRYDEHSLTRETLLSPRLNLAYGLGRRSVIRAAWGRFTQSQRPYELQVEDGETEFQFVERSDHQVLGFEHLFTAAEGRPSAALRVEVYRREIANPLPRYENLWEPINQFPEVEPDRVRVAPERSFAEGVELFLRGTLGTNASWWMNYAYSKSEDEISGRSAPRRFDQTHSLNLDLDYRIGDHWTLNLAWRYHTGWPTTPLSVQEIEVEEDGEIETEFVPVLGPRFSERLSDYHRLDLRASRRWKTKSGTFVFFVDVQNAYDRRNLGGFDFELDEETGELITNEETWAPILPSLGIRFEF